MFLWIFGVPPTCFEIAPTWSSSKGQTLDTPGYIMKCVRGEHPQLSTERNAPGNTYQVARSMLAWRFNNQKGWNETIGHSLKSIRFARSFEFARHT